MMVFRGPAARAAIIIVGILVLIYGSLLLTVNSARFQEWLRLALANQTGYEFAGALRLDPLLRLDANAVSVSKAGKVVLRAERMRMVITPLGLFSKSLHRLSLRKPTFYLELNELFKGSKEPGFDISFRHLNIEDGALVLEVGGGNSLDFKSLAMNAENINLGQATGFDLRAEVPRLRGIAELVVTGDENEKLARLRIQQPASNTRGNSLDSKPRLHDALEAQIKLSKKPDESMAIAATGKLSEMQIGEERFSAHIDARADLGSHREHADFAAIIIATQLPVRPPWLSISLPQGTSTLALEANFSMADKKMTVRSFRLQSPLGDVNGAAQIAFTPELVFSDSKVILRKLPFEHFKSLLPSPMNALVSDGVLDGELKARGAWRSMAVLGTVQGSGIKVINEDFSLESLNFKTPVEWTDSTLRAADVQITGKKLLARQKSDMPVSAEELRIQGTWEQKANAPMKATGQIRLIQGRFASLDGTRVGENLTLAGRFETTSLRDTRDTSIAANLAIEQGEILWGKFFGDLKSQRPTLQFDADYLAGADALRLRQFNFNLATVGKMTARGDIEQLSKNLLLRLELNSDEVLPAGFFEFFIRPTLNRSFPSLNQLSMGGRLAFAVKANGTPDNLSVEGAMQLRGGEIENESKKWQVGPVQLELPFRIQYPRTSLPSTALNVPTGTLTIAAARFGSEVIPATRVTLSLWNNELSFREPIRLPIYGGVLEIADLAFRNLIEDPQALSLSLDVKNLHLQRLTEALGWYHFDGRISGSIPKIEWGSGSLRSQGKIQGQVFGGRVQINNLEIDSPFSSIPSIKLDVLFRNISLDQASATFAFGQISGVLEGTVNQLVITAGQPSEFRADVHSVEKRGVNQRISVESLNKITVLSSGNDAGTLYGGIASFFDTFRYSKLGFKAALKNDKLTLRGVESRQGGEYLVVGSLIPPTVNVVSHTQVIAFSELLRRLEQVQKSGK
jgi:hypothetical protein